MLFTTKFKTVLFDQWFEWCPLLCKDLSSSFEKVSYSISTPLLWESFLVFALLSAVLPWNSNCISWPSSVLFSLTTFRSTRSCQSDRSRSVEDGVLPTLVESAELVSIRTLPNTYHVVVCVAHIVNPTSFLTHPICQAIIELLQEEIHQNRWQRKTLPLGRVIIAFFVDYRLRKRLIRFTKSSFFSPRWELRTERRRLSSMWSKQPTLLWPSRLTRPPQFFHSWKKTLLGIL